MSFILQNAGVYEDIKMEDDVFYKSMFDSVLMEVSKFVPNEFEIEEIEGIGKNVELKYKEAFKRIIPKLLINKYSEDYNEDLDIVLKEINEDNISFKNLKSKIKFIIFNDESYKKEENKDENKFSLESKVTIEDL